MNRTKIKKRNRRKELLNRLFKRKSTKKYKSTLSLPKQNDLLKEVIKEQRIKVIELHKKYMKEKEESQKREEELTKKKAENTERIKRAYEYFRKVDCSIEIKKLYNSLRKNPFLDLSDCDQFIEEELAEIKANEEQEKENMIEDFMKPDKI